MATPVLTKVDFYRRWRRGEFGNRMGSWGSIEEAEADGFQGPTFGIRCVIPKWPHFEAYLPWGKRREIFDEKVRASGTPAKLLVISEDDGNLPRPLQAHVFEPGKLILEYDPTFRPWTLREAHDNGLRTVCDLAAREILRARMPPVDYDELMDLLERYPGHVIEFTVYSSPVGLCPGKCMVVWEVRQY